MFGNRKQMTIKINKGHLNLMFRQIEDHIQVGFRCDRFISNKELQGIIEIECWLGLPDVKSLSFDFETIEKIKDLLEGSTLQTEGEYSRYG